MFKDNKDIRDMLLVLQGRINRLEQEVVVLKSDAKYSSSYIDALVEYFNLEIKHLPRIAFVPRKEE